MIKFYCVLIFLLSYFTFPVDITGLNEIYNSDKIIVFSADNKNYKSIINYIEFQNHTFEKTFYKYLNSKISVYIYPNQTQFSKAVFNSSKPLYNATGFAIPHTKQIFITSFYDTCKSKDTLIKLPIHEIVHLYITSDQLWIREGSAMYFSNMVTRLENCKDIPTNMNELKFYGDNIEDTRNAYNNSGWMNKFIFEEICKRQFVKYDTFIKSSNNYKLIGIKNSNDFFIKFNMYMFIKHNFLNWSSLV